MFSSFLAVTAPAIDLTDVDLSVIYTAITSIVPAVLPTVVGLLGLRKGVSFLMGMIRGA